MEDKASKKWYQKFVRKFRNKYILTFTIFAVYALFIDDNDIFTLVNHHVKLNKLERTLVEKQKTLDVTKQTLMELGDARYLEKFARENKYFKKDNEDIFVITQE